MYYTDRLVVEGEYTYANQLECYNPSDGTFILRNWLVGGNGVSCLGPIYEVYKFDGQKLQLQGSCKKWEYFSDGIDYKSGEVEWERDGKPTSDIEGTIEWVTSYAEGALSLYAAFINEEDIDKYLSGEGKATPTYPYDGRMHRKLREALL